MRQLKIAGMNVSVAGSGVPLVFVHGFTTTSAFWKSQVPVFSQSYQTVVIDLPGHGESDKPTDRSYTIDAFQADVVNVLDELRIDRAILVGLSMGGTIVQSVYFSAPSRVAGLVLVGTTAHGLGRDVRKDLVLTRINELGIAAASCEVIHNSFAPGTAKAILEWAEKEVVKTPRHVAEEAIRSLNEFDSREKLTDIGVPTLVVVGSQDKITPVEESQYLSARIPGARLKIIEGVAHFPMVENPPVFNNVLASFLDEMELTKEVNQ